MMMGSMTRRVLLPLNPVYRLAIGFREMRLRRGWEPVRRLQGPVISIGNLSTGGAGKTPFAIALVRALKARGITVDVLSRGYGRRTTGPVRVDPHGSPADFGDEPLLIAREAQVPVYVAGQRYDAGVLAEANHSEVSGPAGVHILDDAFQHRQLHRDVDILLLNREDWNGSLLPAGNLREPLSALCRADVIAIPDSDSELEAALRGWGWKGPVWRLHRAMEVPQARGPVVAFCGIARPEQFFRGLEQAGLQLAVRVAFRDHYQYKVRDLDRLQKTARSAGTAALVTTAKDQVRLAQLGEYRMGDLPLVTAELTIKIVDQTAALDWLMRRLRDTEVRPSV